MLKRISCLVLAILFALSVAACGGKKEGSKKTSGGKNNGPTNDRVTSGGVAVEVEDEKVLQTKLAKSDFGGKNFVFYYWYEYGDIIDRKVDLFNKQHNANVKVSLISGNFQENIAKSIASGEPFDIIMNVAGKFPQTIFADIYEPLDEYIEEGDYFDASKPKNGGISKVVNETFKWKNKLYACGSAKSCYNFVCYYNKLMFADAGLEDPYQLWKDGKWTWEKFMEMGVGATDESTNIGFTAALPLTIWWTIKGLSPVTRTGDTFKENLASEEIMSSTQEYYNLFFGEKVVSIAKTGTESFHSGKSYTYISHTDAFTVYATSASKSGAFGRDAANLGVVPIPEGLTKDGKYPGHSAQGYSVAKGAKEPSLACAYALFESRVSDSDVNSKLQMPSEIRNYVDQQVAERGYLGFEGFQNSEGKSSREILDPVGQKIRNGGDVTALLNDVRSAMDRMIADTLSNAF